ncbi:hypothetical protein ACWDD9_41230 [Kitasatospora sp. NPDC001119]
MLPLLLSARQYRFGGDVEALSHHLIDTPAIGWRDIGIDLLDGAPEAVRAELIGPHSIPSSQYSADDRPFPDSPPPGRQLVTQDTAAYLSWAYVLRPDGIEVIGLSTYERGPVVPWSTDPTSFVSDYSELWSPGRRAPITAPPSPAAAAARAFSGRVRSAGPVGTAEPTGAHGPAGLPRPAAGRAR